MIFASPTEKKYLRRDLPMMMPPQSPEKSIDDHTDLGRDDSDDVEKSSGLPDMFSLLPDQVVITIISLLPVTAVISTGAVCRRLRYLVTRAVRLDFDASMSKLPGLHEIINGVLDAHDPNHDVDSCRIVYNRANAVHISGWVSKLARLRVRRLRLDATSSCIMYEKLSFGDISTLSELDLSRISLWRWIINPFAGCSALRSLRLRRARLNDDTVIEIIKECPNLQKLSLRSCVLHQLQIVDADSLTYLELADLTAVTITIRAKNLESLTMANVGCKLGVALDAPVLRALSTFVSQQDEEFASEKQREQSSDPGTGSSEMKKKKGAPPSVKSVELLGTWGVYKKSSLTNLKIDEQMFMKLQTLSINMNMNDVRQFVIVGCILRQCVELRELIIKNEQGWISDLSPGSLPYSESQYWNRLADYLECLDSSLNYVEIQGFTGEVYELDFIRSLILKGSNLGRIKILHNLNADDLGLKSTVLLLSLPLRRASTLLKIYIPNIKSSDDEDPDRSILKKWTAAGIFEI